MVRFNSEAAVIDDKRGPAVQLPKDMWVGGRCRFLPDGWPSLKGGRLEVTTLAGLAFDPGSERLYVQPGATFGIPGPFARLV